MSVILIEQQVVHYEVLGRGRPIVFLHGWIGSWRYWIPTMQAASVSYRAYAIDLWGFGDTAKFSPNYRLDKQAQLIDGFLYEMGISRVALVGHGLGGLVAIQYALQHPELVDRVLAVSYPVDEANVASRLRTAPPVELADWLLTKSALAESVLADVPKTDGQSITHSLAELSTPQVKQALAKLNTPCLLVGGQNDPVVTFPDLDVLAALPGQTHAMLFEQSGHFPMLDESSKFNRLLLDFFALSSGESPRQLQFKEEWKRRVR